MDPRHFFLASFACISIAGASRADVLVVNCQQSPGCGLTLPQAIQFAHDGDVVLVTIPLSSGATEIVLDGKGIAIVAQTAGTLWLGSFTIQNVPAGSTALVSGFNLEYTRSPALQQNAGAVRIQDCNLTPYGSGYPLYIQSRSLECTSCSDVALLSCTLRGRDGGLGLSYSPYSPSPALHSISSTIAIDASTLRGGRGYDAFVDPSSGPRPAGHGGPAISFLGGSLVLQSALVYGGRGGTGMTMYGVFPGGVGGGGVAIGNGATARAIGGRTLGGLGGSGGTGGAPDGAHGPPVSLDGGVWSQVQGPDRTFVAPTIAHAGDQLVLTLSGMENEHAVVAGSIGAAHADLAPLDGVLLLQSPMRRMGSGIVASGWTLALTSIMPAVPGGAPNGLLFLQPVFSDALGGTHVGCARVVVQLP